MLVYCVVGLSDFTHAAYSSSFTFSVMLFPYTETNKRPAFATMVRTLYSSKVVAYWRRAISSNLGCLHVPLGVYDAAVWAAGVAGVCGVTGCASLATDMVTGAGKVVRCRLFGVAQMVSS